MSNINCTTCKREIQEGELEFFGEVDEILCVTCKVGAPKIDAEGVFTRVFNELFNVNCK